jgi:hypothetical protein
MTSAGKACFMVVAPFQNSLGHRRSWWASDACNVEPVAICAVSTGQSRPPLQMRTLIFVTRDELHDAMPTAMRSFPRVLNGMAHAFRMRLSSFPAMG